MRGKENRSVFTELRMNQNSLKIVQTYSHVPRAKERVSERAQRKSVSEASSAEQANELADERVAWFQEVLISCEPLASDFCSCS